MEMKNLCGKIPVELHLKVRADGRYNPDIHERHYG